MKTSKILLMVSLALLLLMLITSTMLEQSKLDIPDDEFVKNSTLEMIEYKVLSERYMAKIQEFEKILDEDMYKDLLAEEREYFEYNDGINNRIVEIITINDEKYIEAHSFETLYKEKSTSWFLKDEKFMRIIPNSTVNAINDSKYKMIVYLFLKSVFQMAAIICLLFWVIYLLIEKKEKG